MNSQRYLSAQSIFENADYAGLDHAKAAQLVQLAQTLAANESLCSAVEKLHQQTYNNNPEWGENFPSAEFGNDLNKLYLLLAVDAIRQLRETHHHRAIPETITQITASALSNAARRYSEWNDGKSGLEEWVLRYWFNVIASGNLYRLGRMEFIWEPFEPQIRVYRHRNSGTVQALAEDGVNFTNQGYNPFAFRQEEVARYGWSMEQGEILTASFQENDIAVTGIPISPLGYALRNEITLSLTDWELIFHHGDPVLEMHIPNFAPLSLDLLKDSFQQALEFFPRYHPERPFKAFSCNSWLFNTQWVDWLPARSNVLAFQRQGYLFPIVSDGLEGMYFLFGNWHIDLDKAPLDTTLRRAVIQQLKSGGQLRTGGFFLLPDAVKRFGSEPYRDKN